MGLSILVGLFVSLLSAQHLFCAAQPKAKNTSTYVRALIPAVAPKLRFKILERWANLRLPLNV